MINFNKPTGGEIKWGGSINSNWDMINSSIGAINSQINGILEKLNTNAIVKTVFVGYLVDWTFSDNNEYYHYYTSNERDENGDFSGVKQDTSLDDINDYSVFWVMNDISVPAGSSASTGFDQGDLILKTLDGSICIAKGIGFYYEPETTHTIDSSGSGTSSASLNLTTKTTWNRKFGQGKDEIKSKGNDGGFTIKTPTVTNTTRINSNVTTLTYNSGSKTFTGSVSSSQAIDIADVTFFSGNKRVEVDYSITKSGTTITVTPHPDLDEFWTLAASSSSADRIICRCNQANSTSSTVTGTVTVTAQASN